MDIRLGESRFEAIENDQIIGWLDFRPQSNAVAMSHTVVPEAHAGRGVGTALVAHALAHAMANNWAVLPYCSFVRAYIADHPEYRSLVPADRHDDFAL